MDVEITIDIVCSWSYLTYRRFQHVLAEVRGQGAEVNVRFRPFQLDPSATVAGVPKQEVERRYFGPDFDHVAAAEELSQLGAAVGATFRPGAIWANTFEAHRLIAVASQQGRGEQMTARLFRAHHAERVNVADRQALRTLAGEVGVRWSDDLAEETRQAMTSVRRSGVRGVPVLRFAGGTPLVGDRSEAALREAFERSSQLPAR